MSERSSVRLLVLGALLFSLVATLVGRLFYLQVVISDTYTSIGTKNTLRPVVTLATRGLIVDQNGRPLATNRTSLVVLIDRDTLVHTKDKGAAVLKRLAPRLKTTAADLASRIELCGAKGAAPGSCWNGSPFQPIPIAKDVSTDLALSLMERRADFPGVLAQLQTVREYPSTGGANAAHLLGYLGAISQQELDDQAAAVTAGRLSADQATLGRNDLVGRSGLEAQYDADLRGRPGVKRLEVDIAARVTGTAGETAPVAGNYLVTNLDSRLQSTVEAQLREAIKRARATKAKTGPGNYKADSGAAVVLDVTNGHVLAMASYPTYNPQIWVGGIERKQYTSLTAKSSNFPLISRATQGLFSPASTFKIVSTASALTGGFSGGVDYSCPASVKYAGRVFRNNESNAYGKINLSRALQVSCDTIFYSIARDLWIKEGGLNPRQKASSIEATAARFGLGKRTGIDLPGEAQGQVGGRVYRQNLFDRFHDSWCNRKDDSRESAYVRAIMAYNCTSGNVYQVGDAVNTAIGQGDTAVTPLQMAQAYAALANGGRIFAPQVAKGIMAPTGKAVRMFKPKVTGRLGVAPSVLAYIRDALALTTVKGTGAPPFTGFPLAAVGGIATKTGTAQVPGKQSTSWFASFAPANRPKYAVVMMVAQGGYGSTTSGPSVRKIYEALLGVSGTSVDPTKSILVGGAPRLTLPKIATVDAAVLPTTGKRSASTTPGDGASNDRAVAVGAVLPLGVVLLLGRRVRRRRGAT